MNLKDLQYIVAVAEENHFGRAAKRCFVSQPTLSAQVAKLEAQLGVTLFERLPRKTVVTDDGRALITRAKQILIDVNDLKDHAKQLQNPLETTLTLAVIPTVGPYLLPHIMPSVQNQLPNMQLTLYEYQSEVCIQKLDTHAIDVAILALPYQPAERFEQHHLYNEAFELALPAQHRLAKGKAALHVAQLSNEPMLLLDKGHCLRDHSLSASTFKQADKEFSATSLETLRNFVEMGMGVTLLPELAARRPQSRNIRLRKLAKPTPGREIAMVYRKTSAKKAAISRLVDIITACELPLHNTAIKTP